MNEQQKFFSDLDIPEDSFDKPLTEVEEEKDDAQAEPSEESEIKLKNRRERRLADKLQKEKESNIALNARLQALSEARTTRESTEEADYLKLVEKIYGDETPEAREATDILKKALLGVHKSAKEEAMRDAREAIESERGRESAAVAQEESKLEDMMEELEEEFNVDFSNAETRKGFLTLLEKLSPKDTDGNIIEYADPATTYELFESRRERLAAKNKDLASRHNVRGGTTVSKSKDDATERFLRENGII